MKLFEYRDSTISKRSDDDSIILHRYLRLKTRPTRLAGDGPAYFRAYSGIDGHRFSSFPDSLNIWNQLLCSVRTREDMDFYSTQIQQLNLTALRYDTRAV